MSDSEQLQNILILLKEEDLLPSQIDLSQVGDRYWANVFDQLEDNNLVTEQSYTGFSQDKDTAILKALSERIERLSYILGCENKLSSCMTERSDGFAALPKTFSPEAVRENALSEAIERYVWANWWDDNQITHRVEKLDLNSKLINESEYLKTAFEQIDLEALYVIKPEHDFSDHVVTILFGQLKNAGFVSGGAAGNIEKSEEIFFKAFDELYRHGMAYQKSKKKNKSAKSFYEERLLYFATGKGNIIVQDRLSQLGTKKVVTDDLSIDEMVPSKSNAYHVYRCYFKNQPAFVGGNLERLCL